MSSGRFNSVELIAKLITVEKPHRRAGGSMTASAVPRPFFSSRGWDLCGPGQNGTNPSGHRRKRRGIRGGRRNLLFLELGISDQKISQSRRDCPGQASGLEAKTTGHPVNQICSFLWIYTGYPASSYEGISVELVRSDAGGSGKE